MADSSAEHSRESIVQALAPLSRRRWLRYSLWGLGGMLTLSGVGFAWLRRSPRDAVSLPAGFASLSAAEYQLFLRGRDVLLPTRAGWVPAAEVPVLQKIDALLSPMPEAVRRDLAMGLLIFDHGPLFSGYGSRFVDLSDDDARAYWDRWMNAGQVQRTLANVVKKLLALAYLGHPSAWAAMEYDGPVSRRWGLPSLGNAPLPLKTPLPGLLADQGRAEA